MSLCVVLSEAEFAGALGQATAQAARTGVQSIVRCGAWFVSALPSHADLPIPELIAGARGNLPPYVRIVSGGAPPQAASSAPRGAAGGDPAPHPLLSQDHGCVAPMPEPASVPAGQTRGAAGGASAPLPPPPGHQPMPPGCGEPHPLAGSSRAGGCVLPFPARGGIVLPFPPRTDGDGA